MTIRMSLNRNRWWSVIVVKVSYLVSFKKYGRQVAVSSTNIQRWVTSRKQWRHWISSLGPANPSVSAPFWSSDSQVSLIWCLDPLSPSPPSCSIAPVGLSSLEVSWWSSRRLSMSCRKILGRKFSEVFGGRQNRSNRFNFWNFSF